MRSLCPGRVNLVSSTRRRDEKFILGRRGESPPASASYAAGIGGQVVSSTYQNEMRSLLKLNCLDAYLLQKAIKLLIERL